MALINCSFHSEVLQIASSMNVIVPQPRYVTGGNNGKVNNTKKSENSEYPVLYLLHGLSDDHTIWQRRTSIERYVDGMDLVVVMPAVNRSFYTDMAYGQKYWTFIGQELPFIVKNLFPVSDKREDTFVAGLSMGGYGAFKLALSYPEKFAAGASLSGVLDIAASIDDDLSEQWKLVFGDEIKVKNTDNDLLYLAKKVAKSQDHKPRLFQCCGTEDFLYNNNIRFRDFCNTLPIDLTYEEESGTHEWGYWDTKIQRVLEWMKG